jgi:hypothetical protein
VTGESALRRAEDIGGQELSYAEVKAIASGNPAILTLAEADAELQRLAVLKKSHLDEQYIARRRARDLPAIIADLIQRLSHLTTDEATLAGHADAPIIIGTRACSPEEAPAILAHHLDALPQHVPEQQRIPLGLYRGLRFGLVLHPQFPPHVYVEGAAVRQSMLSREHHGPRAVLNAVERVAGAYGEDRERVRQDLAVAETQLRDYEARLGTPFLHDTILSDLTAARDQLKACLSALTREAASESQPGAAELVRRIEELKAAHTEHAMPERAATRQSSAEEPVTSRIRRRMDRALAPESSDQSDADAQT